MIGTDHDLGRWRGRRVLVTGHTGFKGAWLTLLLGELGAEVIGLALEPEHRDGVYRRCGVHDEIESHVVDIRDREGVARVIARTRPEVVLHLAAQSLVPRGYRDPVGTFEINVIGTAAVLAACGDGPAAVLVVTSDKVYANDGRGRPFVEGDRLGGGDPYSSSKAATELVVQSWRHTFLACGGPALATARAGNVIGGGDQAEGRLLPDIYRAAAAGVPVAVRNPDAVRPWQFVLEPLVGYLRHADRLLDDAEEAPAAVNFGPGLDDAWPVRQVVERVLAEWGGGSWKTTDVRPGPEAGVLMLDASLAREALGWRPQLDLATALAWTTEWYRLAATGGDCRALTVEQIRRYRELAET